MINRSDAEKLKTGDKIWRFEGIDYEGWLGYPVEVIYVENFDELCRLSELDDDNQYTTDVDEVANSNYYLTKEEAFIPYRLDAAWEKIRNLHRYYLSSISLEMGLLSKTEFENSTEGWNMCQKETAEHDWSKADEQTKESMNAVFSDGRFNNDVYALTIRLLYQKHKQNAEVGSMVQTAG